jgi:hypothetical protein
MDNILLWLDDIRDPFENDGHWLADVPFKTTQVIWVNSYKEFVDYIVTNGLPYGISFDHDLGDNYELRSQLDLNDWYSLEEGREYTGYDCSMWLINHCMDNNLPLPKFVSHSANPVGRENILSLLNNFLKHS